MSRTNKTPAVKSSTSKNRFIPAQPAAPPTLDQILQKIKEAEARRDRAYRSATEQIEAMRGALIETTKNEIIKEQRESLKPFIKSICDRLIRRFADPKQWEHFGQHSDKLPQILQLIEGIAHDFYIMRPLQNPGRSVADLVQFVASNNRIRDYYTSTVHGSWLDQRVAVHKNLKRGTEQEYKLSSSEAIAGRLFATLGVNTSTEMILGIVSDVLDLQSYNQYNPGIVSQWRGKWCDRNKQPRPDNRTYRHQPARNMVKR